MTNSRPRPTPEKTPNEAPMPVDPVRDPIVPEDPASPNFPEPPNPTEDPMIDPFEDGNFPI